MHTQHQQEEHINPVAPAAVPVDLPGSGIYYGGLINLSALLDLKPTVGLKITLSALLASKSMGRLKIDLSAFQALKSTGGLRINLRGEPTFHDGWMDGRISHSPSLHPTNQKQYQALPSQCGATRHRNFQKQTKKIYN